MSKRNIFKKSLLRKYWRVQDNKDKDKCVQFTFKKREVGTKMSTRKGNNQQYEVIKKLKIMQDQATLLDKIINFIIKREEYKQIKFELKRLKFEYEITSSKEKRKEMEKIIKEVMSRYIEPKGLDLKLDREDNSILIPNTQSTNLNNRTIKREDKKIEKKKDVIKVDEVKKKVDKVISQSHLNEDSRQRDEKEKELQSFFNFRVRRDKFDRIVIDRYISTTNPYNNDIFGNSINELLLKEDVDLAADKDIFELSTIQQSLNEEYSKGKVILLL